MPLACLSVPRLGCAIGRSEYGHRHPVGVRLAAEGAGEGNAGQGGGWQCFRQRKGGEARGAPQPRLVGIPKGMYRVWTYHTTVL